jgi:hypothetical protein
MINARIIGNKGQSAAAIAKRDNTQGIVAFTEPLYADGAFTLPYINENFGNALNQNPGSGSTPTVIYNEDISGEWATDALLGTWDFQSTTHAKSAISTVVDYTLLSGDTIDIAGTGITTSTLTEGVDWTAATSNNATATSLASAIDGVSGVSASASGAVVTVVADTGADITTYTTSDATNLPSSARSTDASATINNDQAQFVNGSVSSPVTVSVSSYVALSGFLYLTKWSGAGTKNIIARLYNDATQVGNDVNLESFINTATLNEWQEFLISKDEFGVVDEDIDRIIITTSVSSGSPQDYYVDKLSWETAGEPIAYSVAPPKGEVYKIDRLHIQLEDAMTLPAVNGAIPLDPGKLMDEAQLAIGLTLITRQSGVDLFAGQFRNLSDFTAPGAGDSGGVVLIASTTTANLTLTVTFDTPLVLNGDNGDSSRWIVNDDLSGLTKFTIFARGSSRNVSDQEGLTLL